MDCSLMATQAYGDEDVQWESLAPEPAVMADTLLYEEEAETAQKEVSNDLVFAATQAYVDEPQSNTAEEREVVNSGPNASGSPQRVAPVDERVFAATQAYVADDANVALGADEFGADAHASDRVEYPATQAYGDGLGFFAEEEGHAEASEEVPCEAAAPSAAVPRGSWRSAELAATQAYIDVEEVTRDMPETLLYNEDVDDADILNATQAYGDDGFSTRLASPPKPVVEEGGSGAMLPPPPPNRPGRGPRVSNGPDAAPPETKPATAMEDCTAIEKPASRALATPARSPAKRKSAVIIVEDFPEPPKRRRLTGKQSPPSPCPWPSAPWPARGSARQAHAAPRKPKQAKSCRPRGQQVCFATTGIVLDKAMRGALKKVLGARVADEWSPKVTHVIADEFRRTTKLMAAVCAGCEIVIPAFLDACLEAGELVDCAAFRLADPEGEADFAAKQSLSSYSLQAALLKAREEGPLLRGRSVHWLGGSAADRKDMRVLVESAGGRWLGRRPRASKAAEPGQIPSVFLLGKDYSPELLREAACTQALRLSKHEL